MLLGLFIDGYFIITYIRTAVFGFVNKQDDDVDMLRVQSAHHVPSGGTGVAGLQRMGRYGSRAGKFLSFI